ncbi:MAG: tyrosine-type recombinase/integrase [Candidatus Thorarchaeota archaeon]
MGIYKRGKKWYADFYYEGRRIRKAVGSKKDAENAMLAIKADILRGDYRFRRERKIKFEDFADEYLEKYSKVNKKSWKSDQTSLNQLIPFFKGMKLNKITPRHIEEYKKKRIEKVKPSSINRELACLKTLFSVAKKWKLVDENPAKEVKLFQEQKIEMRILDKDEMKRLLDNSCEHLRTIIIIALNTGMRRSEIFKLRWNDIDFINDYIFIKETKSALQRKIPMNSIVSRTIKRMKRESDFLFYNPKTKDRIKDVKTSFKAACRRSGINDFRFHDLRHTAATNMVIGGIDLVTVAEILGHSDIKMTMRYAHPTPENKRKAVNVLASMFEQQNKYADSSLDKSGLDLRH